MAAAAEQNYPPCEAYPRVKSHGMDSAVNAMLFAEDLVEYVLRKLGYEWVPESGVRQLPKSAVKKRFLPEVGEAVFDIISCRLDSIFLIYEDLKKKKINEPEDFRRQLCIIAVKNFTQNHFDPLNFLILAAHIVGVSAFYFEKGNTKIADATAQTLAHSLNFFIYYLVFDVQYSWFTLCLLAQRIRREIKVKGKLEYSGFVYTFEKSKQVE